MGGDPATDGCPDAVTVDASGECTGRMVIDLAGGVLPSTQQVTSDPTGKLAVNLTAIHVDLWFQPELFEEFSCDLANAAQAVLYRYALFKESIPTDGKYYSQFAEGEADETRRVYYKRGQHTWWPVTECQFMLTAPGFGGMDPCELATPGGNFGPYFPAADSTGTIEGAASTLMTVREDRPWHLKFSHRRRITVKDDESLILLVEWGNPFLACAGAPSAIVNWKTDWWGRIEAHQTLGV